MRIRLAAAGALASALALTVASIAVADEGMWTFDNFPSAKVKQLYGFAPDQKWLDRVRKATVRLENGCSGGVMSKDGLVLTNHHCVTACTTALSSVGHDYVDDGFYTQSRREERICPGMEASILQSTTDVTQQVKSAGAAGRAAAIAQIEEDACGEIPSRRCDVVDLYRGGQYKLYVYDRYDDVRVVFAPEMQAAFFGGDPDNFNYPRYALDMALVRLYRDGKPAVFADPLRLDPAGPKTGDLIFVSGYPLASERLLTNSQLAFERDHFLPWRIELLSQLRGALLNEATKGEEEARQVNEALLSVENTLKVYRGQRAALVEPSFFAVKTEEEKVLNNALATKPVLRAKYGDPFADLAAIAAAQQRNYLPYQMLEERLGVGSLLLNDARTLYRAATEREKPDSQRLADFRSARLDAIEHDIMAEAPLPPALETLIIAFWLEKTREYLGADNPAVKAMFGRRTSREIALDIVANSQVGDPAFRKRVWDDPALARTSGDPALVLVRLVDSAARDARRNYERDVVIPTAVASAKVAGLRFDVHGESLYPDANFSLRLSFGVVKGWTDPIQGDIPPFTYVSGLWDRVTGAYPLNLAARWIGAEKALPGDTQFDFTSTNDIIGGNSGSPVLNKAGRVVGLAFDGNIHSTGGAYGFDPALNRMVSLSSQAIVGALRNIYGATALADELAN